MTVNDIRVSNRASNIKIIITKILIGYYTLSIVKEHFKIDLEVTPNVYCIFYKNNTGNNAGPVFIIAIAFNHCLHY